MWPTSGVEVSAGVDGRGAGLTPGDCSGVIGVPHGRFLLIGEPAGSPTLGLLRFYMTRFCR